MGAGVPGSPGGVSLAGALLAEVSLDGEALVAVESTAPFAGVAGAP